MESIPSVAQDGTHSNRAAQHATAPARTSAMGLLSAAEIWSTPSSAPAPARTPENIAAEPLAVKAETTLPQPEAVAEVKARSVRERFVAAIWSTTSSTPVPVNRPAIDTPEMENFESDKPETVTTASPLPRSEAATDAKFGDAKLGEVEPVDVKASDLNEGVAADIPSMNAATPVTPEIPEQAKIPETKTPESKTPESKIPETATIANVLPQFAAAAEVPALRTEQRFLAKGISVETSAVAERRSEPQVWPPRKLSLALQGGGSFAAYTWGVLERLLEEPGCEFDVVSGASAGAVNAALLASGLIEGGREGAHALLRKFWTRISTEASFRSQMLIGGFSPAGSTVAFGPALRSGQFDPFDLDPLRQALEKDINFAALHDPAALKLIVAATRVRDGALRIFRNEDITPDVLLASTCPPQVNCSVEIHGEAYWDGGYGANPPLVRLVQESDARDVLVVQVTPARDSTIPMTMAAIDRRLDQITANSVLSAEIAALEWAREIAPSSLRALRVSRIAAEDEIEGLAQRSPVDLGRNFIGLLHRNGRAAADRWLSQAPDGRQLAIQPPRREFSVSGTQPTRAEPELV
jgi:NTE family protein